MSIGFCVANVLIGFVVHETNTDNSLLNKHNIYRLVSDDPWERGQKVSFLSHNVVKYINDNFPEVESSCTMNTIRNNGISRMGDPNRFDDLTILGVDSTFFEIFDFPFYQGIAESALKHDNIILTKLTADILFGKNKLPDNELVLNIDTSSTELNVAGILELPENSHLKFDALVDLRHFSSSQGGITYFLLSPYASGKHLESKLQASSDIPSVLGNGKIDYFLQPLESVYWDEDNSRSFSKSRNHVYIWICIGITILVLFLAGYNFLSLFIVSFQKRWKEFGLKKVLGATSPVLQLTVVIEAGSYILISFLLSVGFTYLFLPQFNSLVSTGLSLTYISTYKVISIISLILIIIVILVIFRISKLIFKINPLSLIGKRTNPKIRFNSILIGLQFSISSILLICAILMIRQITFISEKPLGFHRNILEVRSPAGYLSSELTILKQELITVPCIESISVCSGNPISDNMIARYDLEDGSFYTPYIYFGDEDHLKTLGIDLIEGEVPSSTNTDGRLVNQKFVELFDFDDPIGAGIPGEDEAYISGVVQDFICSSLKQVVPPVMISYADNGFCLLAKVDMNKLSSLLPQVEKAWQSRFPDYPFKYLFIDSELDKKHAGDSVISKILIVSTLLSIFITCFGIFALAWGVSQDRSKEIGIRKVIGATSLNILSLLLKDYIFMI
ncbi:ABC transporter permease, partial [Bacteroidota bacterium]